MIGFEIQPNDILATFSYSMQYSCHSSFGVCAASSIICKDKMNMCLLLKFIFIWGLKKLSDDSRLFICTIGCFGFQSNSVEEEVPTKIFIANLKF